MKIYIKGRKVIISNLIECNFFKSFVGLMFSNRENANALLFNLRDYKIKGIHSFFVFFPFLAIWINNKNKVVDYKIVYPFTPFIISNKKFSKLIEIPFNKKYREIFNILKIKI